MAWILCLRLNRLLEYMLGHILGRFTLFRPVFWNFDRASAIVNFLIILFYFQQNLNNVSNYFAYLQGYAKVFYSSTVIWILNSKRLTILSRKEHEGSYILQEAVEHFPCILPAEGDAMKWYDGQSIVVQSDSQAATQGRVSSISVPSSKTVWECLIN